jgi:hypothetical protein
MSKVAALRAMREARHAEAEDDAKRDARASFAKHRDAIFTALTPAQVMGAKGGKSKSPAKQAASRANGKKGGKPKRNPSA